MLLRIDTSNAISARTTGNPNLMNTLSFPSGQRFVTIAVTVAPTTAAPNPYVGTTTTSMITKTSGLGFKHPNQTPAASTVAPTKIATRTQYPISPASLNNV